MSILKNTGRKFFQLLEQYNISNGQPTGIYKPNNIGDPDYIAPVIDLVACPIDNNPNYKLSTIKASVYNNTNQSVLINNVIVQVQGDLIPLMNQVYSQGPGQQLNSQTITQGGSYTSVKLNNISLPILNSDPTVVVTMLKISILWIRNNTTTTLFSQNFTLDQLLLVEALLLPTNFQPVDESNEIRVVIEQVTTNVTTTTTQPTTTTTTQSTTTTTTSTSTTTTKNPNANILVLVQRAASKDGIASIKIKDSNGVETLIEDVIINTASGLKSYSVLKNTYQIILEMEASAGGSQGALILSNGIDTISQQFLGGGFGNGVVTNIYVFDNIVIGDDGLNIILNEDVAVNRTVFCKQSVDPNITDQSTPVQPYGLIKTTFQDQVVNFYEDVQMTIPIGIQATKLTYNIQASGSQNYSQEQTVPLTINDMTSIFEDTIQIEQWDYTIPDPNDQKITDVQYQYTILPGYGYIIIN